KLNLKPYAVQLHQLVPIKSEIRGGQDNVARFGCRLTIDEHDEPQLPLEGDMPDEGRVEANMGHWSQLYGLLHTSCSVSRISRWRFRCRFTRPKSFACWTKYGTISMVSPRVRARL